MAEILPDGTFQNYFKKCEKCGGTMETNIQGNEIGDHVCKTILIKFPNGDWFEVPLQKIAEHRAKYYDETDVDSVWQDEVDLVMNEHLIGLDWLQNNMDWVDVYPLGVFINAEQYDYNKGFFDAQLEVLKK